MKTKRRHGGLTRSEYLDSESMSAFREFVKREAELSKKRLAWTDHIIVEILSRTGLRAGELLQGEEHPGRYLRLRDINLDPQRPSIFVADGKRGVSRVIYIHSTLRDLIESYIQQWLPNHSPDWPLICSKPGLPLKTAALRMKCRRWQEAYETKTKIILGCRLHPHLFRHSFAVWFLDANGGDMAALLLLKDVLGHDDIQTTFVYLHSSEKLRRGYVQHLV